MLKGIFNWHNGSQPCNPVSGSILLKKELRYLSSLLTSLICFSRNIDPLSFAWNKMNALWGNVVKLKNSLWTWLSLEKMEYWWMNNPQNDLKYTYNAALEFFGEKLALISFSKSKFIKPHDNITNIIKLIIICLYGWFDINWPDRWFIFSNILNHDIFILWLLIIK